MFCVRADSADEGTAVTPAVGRYDDVTVAVIGGGDPRRAAGVRDGVVEALRSGTLADRRHRGAENPGVTLVGGGPGDPGLITVRGRQALAQADVVVTDRLAPQALLDELPPDVTVIDASKLPRGRYMSQDTINAVLVDSALAGQPGGAPQGRRPVRLRPRLRGDPGLRGGRGHGRRRPGRHLGDLGARLRRHPRDPPRDHPRVRRGLGAPAARARAVARRLGALGRLTGTIVLLMAVENIGAIAEALVAGGRDPETPAVAVQEGGLPGEALARASLAKLPSAITAAGLRPPAVVVIGAVADPEAFPAP